MPETGREPAPLVLELSGEIDVALSDDIVVRGAALLAKAVDGQPIVIDLARVEFIDSSGLSGLLRLRRQALSRGLLISLRDVPPQVAVLLSLSGIDQLLPTERRNGPGLPE